MNKTLYQCQNCLAIYEDRQRAKRCHEGLIVVYDVILKKRTSCMGSYKHLYTSKDTGKGINYCYYCNKKKPIKVIKNG